MERVSRQQRRRALFPLPSALSAVALLSLLHTRTAISVVSAAAAFHGPSCTVRPSARRVSGRPPAASALCMNRQERRPQEPLNDDSRSDVSSPAAFTVTDMSGAQPSRPHPPTPDRFEDAADPDWDLFEEADAGALVRKGAPASHDDGGDGGADGSGPLAAGGAADLASDGEVWDTYDRDDDDLRTEREDRLYVDQKGLTRRVETCVLVGVEDIGEKRRKAKKERMGNLSPEEDQVYFTLEESLNEMRDLIKTSGLELVGEVTQRLNEPNPKTYIGTGKMGEVQEMLQQLGSCTVVFDAELTPGQQKGLENTFNRDLLQNDFMGADQEGDGSIKVVDRTALILDIFAQHARTREGKLQVDLALHEYRKPRLTKMWTHLERQSGSGGVGLRGPGESQLEIDRRLVRDRIIVLKRKIDDVQKQRGLHRKGRRSNAGLPLLSLVGYTNAGKSTLLNYLTKAGVMAEDILFATLDPTTRKVKLPGQQTHPEVLLTDTVGFIQKLPTHLVAAFRATLEEVLEADVLVHIVDVSSPVWRKQERSVLRVLDDIGAGDKPVVRVLNKIDLLDRDDASFAREEMSDCKNAVALSSVTGEGMEEFVAVTEQALSGLLVPVELEIPYSKGNDMNSIHEVGAVDIVEYREDGTYVKGRVPRALAMRLNEYSVKQLEKEDRDQHPLADRMRQIEGKGEWDNDEVDWTDIGRGRHRATKSIT